MRLSNQKGSLYIKLSRSSSGSEHGRVINHSYLQWCFCILVPYLTDLSVIQDCLCGLVVRVPGYRTEMYCVSSEILTEFIYVMKKKVVRLCGLVVRVPGYRTEMYCVSSEILTEFIYVM
jgi:hypothetical protein